MFEFSLKGPRGTIRTFLDDQLSRIDFIHSARCFCHRPGGPTGLFVATGTNVSHFYCCESVLTWGRGGAMCLQKRSPRISSCRPSKRITFSPSCPKMFGLSHSLSCLGEEFAELPSLIVPIQQARDPMQRLLGDGITSRDVLWQE